jgi:hypothetical protein
MASPEEELATLCESIAARERHIRDFYKHTMGESGWQNLLSRDLAIVPAIEESYARIFSQLKEKYASESTGGDVLLAELARHMALTAVSEDRARRLQPDRLAGYERLVEWRKRVGGLGVPPELEAASEPAYARALEEQQRAIHAHLASELADSGAHPDELVQMARTIAEHRLHAAYATKMMAS